MPRAHRFSFIRLVALVLMLVSIAGTAEAKSTHKKKKKAAPAIEMTNAAPDPDGREPASGFERARKQSDGNPDVVVGKPGPIPFGKPIELQLKRAGSRHFDLRSLPQTKPVQQERAELPAPAAHPVTVQGIPESPSPSIPSVGFAPLAPAPPPTNVFEGLDRFNWGAGSPPDTNGDVGPNDYIQTVNTSIGVFNKSDGSPKAIFTFNTFMSQGNFGNLCDTNNFGDPVVLYDSFEDRWIITDFAFLTDISGNVLAPAYQCFAASMSGDPVSGGWNFYSIQISDALNDYPKLGIWPDGLYMSANLFTFGAGSAFKNARAWAFNKAQMYAGSPTVKVVTFDIGGGDFAVMPSNARLQTGTPPPGRPNLFISTWQFLNAVTVYKFHVDWDHLTLSTFTGPDVPLAATSWPNAAVANVPQSGTSQLLDALQIRAMVQNQYTNFGGVESLWIPHTVRRANTTGFAAPRWYQVDVSGGTVNANLPQATTWDPDAANVMHRWMPSLALDRAGNMAMGYSTSNSSTFPSMKYAGRLAADPVNTFSLTEQTFFAGTASQLSSTRWGDYSSVSLDPDGCTFWLTNEYATGLDNTTVDPTSFNKRWQTKFGKFGPFPGCVPVGAGGTISGTVTVSGNPLPGATVALGVRSATTDGSGNYAFNVPAGTYPSETASKAGFGSSTATSIAVTDGNTTTQNFALTAAPTSSCLTDTTQTDFQTGVPSATVDLTTSPGDVTLSNAPAVDQLNTAGTTTGTGFGTPAWCGQTFIAGVTGQLAKADFTLFCNGCGATPPNLTLSVRATSGGLPTGADLASVSIPGSAFASGATTTFTATFSSPATLTSGTQYALVLRPVSAPAGSGYFWIRSSPSTYANGSRVLSADSGTTWSADTTRDFNFHTYMQTGYSPSGTFVSGPKDSNPAGGITPIWSTFSWNGSVPANTSLSFQLAASNNANGPFNFVGPDGTAATFFTTSPVQLSPQFYNLRYMEYKAFLGTTNSAVTPALNDATFCFNDVDCSGVQATITPTPSPVCGLSTGNTASAPPGMTAYAWGITNGTITSATNVQTITYTAGGSGTLTLTLTVTAPNGCIVSGSQPVTINTPPTKPNISGTLSFCIGGNTTLTSDSGSGNQWYLAGNPISGETNQTLLVSAAGSYTVQVTDGNGCKSQMSDPAVVTQNTPPPTPTISADTNGTGTQDQACPEVPLTLHANGATGAVSYQWYKDIDAVGTGVSTYQADGAATYYVTATDANGCTTPKSAGYVVQNPTPHSPFVSFRGQASSVTTLDICMGSSQIIDSDSATGIHWWVDGVDQGPGSQSYTFTPTGPGTHTFTAQLNALGCHSQFGRTVTINVNALPPTPTVTPGGPTTFCAGGSVTLTSSSATGNQWKLNGSPIGGATSTTYNATASGNYTVTVTDGNGCTATSAATTVTVNPLPATPTITPSGPTTFCAGGSVTLTSSSASGNQWLLNGAPIGGATSQTYIASSAGDYSVTVTDGNGCTATSAVTTVTVNPNPNATITAPGTVASASTGNTASVASAGAGATYNWSITNGTITAGTGTNSITFTAGAVGTLTLQVTVTTSAGCSDTKSANVTVGVPAVTVTSVSPNTGSINGHTSVTVNGTGFASGATVKFGGNSATSVVVVNATKITAVTPAHAAGQVNVVVTNTDTSTGTLTNGYTYKELFDANGDHTIDPSDIFYLISYLFLHGPAPVGGVSAGDANGDGVVDPADIFYLVNYLYLGGPAPYAEPAVHTSSVSAPMKGSISLGQPVLRGDRYVIPVTVTGAPSAMSLHLRFDEAGEGVIIHGASGLQPAFEISRHAGRELTYLVAYDGAMNGVVANIELPVGSHVSSIEVDSDMTLLCNRDGMRKATVAGGTLTVSGTAVNHERNPIDTPRSER